VGLVVMWLHLVAAAVWLGGLLWLVARYRRGGPGLWLAVRRFSPWAIAATVVVVATGVANVDRHVGPVGPALGTTYGRVLIAKLTLVVVAVAVAVVVRGSLRSRWVRTESGVLVAVAALAGTLGALPLASAAVLPAAVSFGPATAASVGQLLGTHLVRSGHRVVTVVGDGSPRALAMERALVGTGMTTGPDGDAVVLTGTRTQAAAAIASMRSPTVPLVLAPWLLDPQVLEPAIRDPNSGQVVVALPFDPAAASTRSYLAAAAGADRVPTAEGLLGWLRAAGPSARADARMTSASLQLFTPARLGVLPAFLEHEHDHGDGWFAQGGLAPVSAVLR
jgi:copper transport protein